MHIKSSKSQLTTFHGSKTTTAVVQRIIIIIYYIIILGSDYFFKYEVMGEPVQNRINKVCIALNEKVFITCPRPRMLQNLRISGKL